MACCMLPSTGATHVAGAFNYGNTKSLIKHFLIMLRYGLSSSHLAKMFMFCVVQYQYIQRLVYAFEVLIQSMFSACFKRFLNDLLQHQSYVYLLCLFDLEVFVINDNGVMFHLQPCTVITAVDKVETVAVCNVIKPVISFHCGEILRWSLE